LDNSQKILSDIVVFTKYARYIPEINRRETWEELITRNMVMHIRKYPVLKEEIREVYNKFVLTKKVLPSMRSLQFGGRPIELSPNRIFNCAYLPIDHPDAFSEMMFLLLGGTGAGYSVQEQHVGKLPVVKGPNGRSHRFLIGDSIEGWADTIKMLIESYFYNKPKIVFDYRDIRDKGAPLITSGGKAPGAQPLKDCVHNVTKILDGAVGRKLRPIEAHDISCFIADAVLAGGIRRAALISLFSRTDNEMLNCKQGAWWELNPQRGRANNSVVLPRDEVGEAEFKAIFKRTELSRAGEPGVYWTNNTELGTNPCCEISLEPFQFCNLCEVNVSNIESQEDLNERVKAAAFIGTLQAGYTDFHYLRPIWQETTERDALIGVGMTGIGSGVVLKYDMSLAASLVIEENIRVAAILGINTAKRTTTVKPSGTSSLVLGTSSGVHAWYNDYYIRRMRLGKDESITKYLADNVPQLIEDDFFRPEHTSILSIPQKAPEGSLLRTESAFDLLDRVKKVNKEWIRAGHIKGDNTHNVSCTISLKDDEWDECANWMWKNRNYYNGISVLNYDGGSYPQAPFEDCSQETYKTLMEFVKDINLSSVKEVEDNTDLSGEIACGSGGCEIV